MASVFRHVKAIKLSAYEPYMISKAVDMRAAEIKALRKWLVELLKVSIVTNWLSSFLGLVTIITFTVVSLYTTGGNSVTTAKVFSVITVIQLISEPLLMLGQQWGKIVTAWASFNRIEVFLLREEKDGSGEPRIIDGNNETIQYPGDQEGKNIKLDVSTTRPIKRAVLTGASFGIAGKLTLLKELEVDVKLAGPALWMVVGRVGSVSPRCYSIRLHHLFTRLPWRASDEADHAVISGKVYPSTRSTRRIGLALRDLERLPRNRRFLLTRSLASTIWLDQGKHHVYA